ncbi:hypothetical protein CBM2615_B110053 [Cupriavidus taiwanensis]|uniref:Uncharacterized protein n=1 Tax=Cupriavidus taiwanensis TaxID=164546 RepID=A0A375EFV9_9BURK|nr:hypothetical protein CBM2614_B110053 [Cupriavidus taiwanensis]SOZ63220.1 hypothetical protein CBM2615_B110053 [Cupriavidus taiwanensis]SOZ74187.1 hypothetical protein CBM2613_B80051 [Cupriavidus taiwanensis]SPA11089.1 hypothetical protein CBM2625_B90053 [Cupriavidus taiwanensis]
MIGEEAGSVGQLKVGDVVTVECKERCRGHEGDRPGDALFASFLSLDRKGGRRLRRRNSHASQARPPTTVPTQSQTLKP